MSKFEQVVSAVQEKELRYFHISFDDSLEGVWSPKLPDGHDNEGPIDGDEFSEPSIRRICTSKDLEGCFRAVYPNVYKYFEVKKFPEMNFHIYEMFPKKKVKELTTKELTDQRLVWDAHVTNEHVFLEPVHVKLVGRLKVYNTNKSEILYTHPFNDERIEKTSVGPKDIKFEVKWK